MKQSFLILILFLAFTESYLNAQICKGDSSIEMSYRNKNNLRESLLPVPKEAIFKMDGYYLWDPSVIKVGRTYHLFASRWPESTGMEGWRKSHIIRATSNSLFGPYTFAEEVFDLSKHPWATEAMHNPKIMKTGKKFLLYHLGIPLWQTGFAFADKIEGPWTPIKKPVIATNNPAILIKPDGKVYVVGKFKPKTTKDGQWDAYMQAYEADSIMGSYKLVGDNQNRLPYNFELEDPSIWWANNQFNVICTDWEAKVTGINKAVVYYTSKDGINYKLYSNIPVWSQNDAIPVCGGDSLTVTKVERPQVYVDKNQCVTALLAAVHPSGKAATYIVVRPVKNFKPNNKN